MGYCAILKEIFKPPLLIFCATVTVLAITLFAYSLSLEINDEKILNPDIRNWNSFCKSVSALSACLVLKSDTKSKNFAQLEKQKMRKRKIDSKDTNVTSVSFLTDTSLVLQGNVENNFFLYITVNAEELDFDKSKDKIEMIISLPKKKKSGKACVSVVGPSHLLPDGASVLSKCSQPKNPPQRQLLLMLPSKVENKKYCPSRVFGSLKIEENESLNVYLSHIDTNLIQMHIFVSSSLLCGMILLFFLYSLVGKLCRVEKKYSSDPDMVPLDL